MQPISEFHDRLFMAAGASDDQVVHFSCGHVIPPDGILPIAVTNGPSGIILDYSYKHRSESSMVSSDILLIFSVCYTFIIPLHSTFLNLIFFFNRHYLFLMGHK